MEISTQLAATTTPRLDRVNNVALERRTINLDHLTDAPRRARGDGLLDVADQLPGLLKGSASILVARVEAARFCKLFV